MWAAESRRARLTIARQDGQRVRLAGRKAWCSGAAVVDHALVTAALASGGTVLVAVPMQQSGVAIEPAVWKAVGMAPSASADVGF